jgi:anti-anti-sigma factor
VEGRMPLTFTVDRRGEGVRLALAGDLDLSESDFAGNLIQLVVTDKSERRVEVDLAGVTFLDSSGIAAIMAGRATALDRGCCFFTATNTHGVVRRILEVTKLLEVLSGEAPERPETSADPRW